MCSSDLIEQLSNGRADALFSSDRKEGARYGFGFPTIVIRRPTMEEPKVLQGSVPYRDLLDGLYAMGVDHKSRKRFRGTDSDWRRLLEMQPRITMAELQMVTTSGTLWLGDRRDNCDTRDGQIRRGWGGTRDCRSSQHCLRGGLLGYNDSAIAVRR